VRTGGLEPPRAFALRIFIPLRLSPPHFGNLRCRTRVRGLDHPFAVARGFRRCPSGLYTFPFPGLARDCHVTGFPEFEQFCTSGFLEGTQDWFKSVASTIPPRPLTPRSYNRSRAQRQGARRMCGERICVSESGIILWKIRANPGASAMSPDRNMVRNHLRASVFVAFLIRAKILSTTQCRRWPKVRISARIRKKGDGNRCARICPCG